MCGVAATTTVRLSHQPPPLCALPRPVRCVCECEWWHHAHPPTVVPPTLVCVCVSGVATTPTTHAVVPCALSLLSLAMPHLPHSHKCHASLHSHMACFVWLLPSIHTHTGWLTAHTPSTHHHHWVCVCSSTCSHPPHTHTHTRDAQAWPMHGWLLVWSPPPRPLCPTITHTHTAGLVVWAMVVLGGARVPCVCLPRHHHTRLPSHHHHQRSCATTALTHTHTGLGACTTATHTPHAPPHTPRRAVC